jgi:hypothetical protein
MHINVLGGGCFSAKMNEDLLINASLVQPKLINSFLLQFYEFWFNAIDVNKSKTLDKEVFASFNLTSPPFVEFDKRPATERGATKARQNEPAKSNSLFYQIQ